MTSTSPTCQQNDSAFNSIRSYEDFSELEDEEEIDKLLDLQTRIFEAICNESRTTLRKLFDTSSASLILQILLTFIYPNTDLHFCHDTDFIYDAEELLGNSVKNLNAIQAACMLGDEELALDILNFVITQCELMDARKVLFEFLSKVWGDNCTTLHLASFMGMSELVKKLLESGANPNKVNDRKYKPVDCADDDKTRALFLNLSEVVRFPIRRTLSVDGGGYKIPNKFEPIFTKGPYNSLDRQNSFKSAYALRGKDNLESVSESPPLQMQRAFSLQGQELVETLSSSSSESVTLAKSKPLRRIKFDPLTLALDYARQGDSIHLQKILESTENTEFFDSILESEGLPSVYDLVTPHTNMSLLHLAASYNHLAVCQYLIEKGANTNVTDLEGWTPLHCCAAEGHSKVVKLLLSVQNILLDRLNSDQETALDVCQDENIKRMIKDKIVKRMSLDISKLEESANYTSIEDWEGCIQPKVYSGPRGFRSSSSSRIDLGPLSSPIISMVSDSTKSTNNSSVNTSPASPSHSLNTKEAKPFGLSSLAKFFSPSKRFTPIS